MSDPRCSTAVPRRVRVATVAVTLSLGVIALTAMLATGSAAAPLMDDNLAEQNNTTQMNTSSVTSTPSNTATTNEGLFSDDSSTNDTDNTGAESPDQQTETQSTSKSLLIISGNGSYEFSVVENLTGVQTGSKDLVGDTRAKGKVNGAERDIYVFDYGLMGFESNGSLNMTLNGNSVDQQVLNGHRLAIYKYPPQTENGSVQYEVTVSGTIAPSALGNKTQLVDSDTVRGKLDPYDGITAFYYTGQIAQFEKVGDTRVTIDNKRVDPDELSQEATTVVTTQSPRANSDSNSGSESNTGQRDPNEGTATGGATSAQTTSSSGSGAGFGLGLAAGAFVLSVAVIGAKRRL